MLGRAFFGFLWAGDRSSAGAGGGRSPISSFPSPPYIAFSSYSSPFLQWPPPSLSCSLRRLVFPILSPRVVSVSAISLGSAYSPVICSLFLLSAFRTAKLFALLTFWWPNCCCFLPYPPVSSLLSASAVRDANASLLVAALVYLLMPGSKGRVFY